MKSNLRHLRTFLAVAETGAITRAADVAHVSQPAVTQAVGKLERMAGQPLFLRRPSGMFPTDAGVALAARVRRALAFLDPVLGDVALRLRLTATTAQLQALIAMREAQNFTLAARRMGLAQPTVHRAITQLEQEAGRPLFERTSYGMIPTRAAEAMAQAARLAFAELDQAEADLAEMTGQEVGRIVVGAMPLSRSSLLPRAIARFRTRRPTLQIKALDGPYDDMITGLRRGDVDFLVGALRDPPPIGDVVQERLFDDRLVIVCGPSHPLVAQPAVTLADAVRYPFVIANEGTPARIAFDRLFAPVGPLPSLIETGSMILMREMLRASDHLGCISALQVEREVALGALRVLPVEMSGTIRAIGFTFRRDWLATRAQAELIADIQHVALNAGRDGPERDSLQLE